MRGPILFSNKKKTKSGKANKMMLTLLRKRRSRSRRKIWLRLRKGTHLVRKRS